MSYVGFRYVDIPFFTQHDILEFVFEDIILLTSQQ